MTDHHAPLGREVITKSSSSIPNARADARARVERQTAIDVRGYGGRRTGFKVDKEEQAKLDAMDRHLLDLARRAIERHR
jgi:hypothetical protein